MTRETYIDSEAEVDPSADVQDSEINEDVVIGPYAEVLGSVVHPGVEIGRGAVVCHVYIGIETVVLEHARLLGEHNHPIHVGPNCTVGPRTEMSHGASIGLPVPWFKVSGVLTYKPDWTQWEASSLIGESSYVGVDVHINDTRMDERCWVGTESVVAGCVLSQDVTVEAMVLLLNCRVGEYTKIGRRAVVYDAKKIDDEVVIGERAMVQKEALLASGCQIGDHVLIGLYAAIRPHVRIGDGSSVGDRTTVGTYSADPESATVISERCRIGHRVKIANEVIIEAGADIGDDAVIERGAHIGDNAVIGPAYVVREGERVPPNARLTGTSETFAGEEHFPLAPTAESFVYSRLAEVAGSGRLTKDKIKSERPELLEHPITKEALRARPRPTGQELRHLAEEASRGVRYHVKIRPGGWRGGQRLGRMASDVVLFNVTDEMLDAVVAHMDDKDDEEAKSQIIHFMGADNIHFSVRTVGWVRMQVYCEHAAVVIEELQTDIKALRMIMGDPAQINEVLDGIFHSLPCLPFDELREDQKSAAAKAYLEAHDMDAVLERMQTEKEQVWQEIAQWFEDWCQAWRNFFIATHDIYEVMLSTVLDMASGRIETSLMGCPIDSVYLLTHETKSRIRDAGRPPVYPYSKLYKMFQSAQKLPLPDWVDTRGWIEPAPHEYEPFDDERFRPPERKPTARLLRPNE